jgi:hypothetical protein
MLSLRGKSIFNILSDIDVSSGFCGIICYVKSDVVPIAYGINGNGSYDWRAILNATLPPVFPKEGREKAGGEIAFDEENEPTVYEMNTPIPKKEPRTYDDEEVATENYYEVKEDERIEPTKTDENARTQSATESKNTEERANSTANGDASSIFTPFGKNPDGYYLSIKRELEELFSKYPQDTTLCGAFSHSEWVRLKGTKEDPQYLVGALFEEGKARYICYALYAENKDAPPEEIKNVCTFVPVSPLLTAKGFFVIFQSAASGECVKPERI